MKDKFWIKKDYLYFILSILIVFSHSTGYAFYDKTNIELHTITRDIIDYFVDGINSIAVPIFMLFSALLLFRNLTWSNMWKKMKSRFISLGVPYLVWNCLSVVWAICIAKLPFLRANVTGEREIFSFSNLWKGILLYEYNGVMWYIAQLIIFLVLCPVLYVIVKRKVIGFFLVLASGIIYIMEWNLPLCLLRQDVLFYYIIGAYLGVHFWEEIHTVEFKRMQYIFSVIGVVGISFFAEFSYRGVDIIWTLLAAIFIYIISDWIANTRGEKWWISISFYIYALHNFVQPCINKVFWLFAPHNNLWALFNLFGGVLITIGLCVLSAIIFRNVTGLHMLWNILNGDISLKISQKQEKEQCRL